MNFTGLLAEFSAGGHVQRAQKDLWNHKVAWEQRAQGNCGLYPGHGALSLPQERHLLSRRLPGPSLSSGITRCPNQVSSQELAHSAHQDEPRQRWLGWHGAAGLTVCFTRWFGSCSERRTKASCGLMSRVSGLKLPTVNLFTSYCSNMVVLATHQFSSISLFQINLLKLDIWIPINVL